MTEKEIKEAITARTEDISIDTLIAYWKEQLPPLVDYAELVGAPAWAYGYEYVYEDEYGYMVEATIKALEDYKNHLNMADNLLEEPVSIAKATAYLEQQLEIPSLEDTKALDVLLELADKWNEKPVK